VDRAQGVDVSHHHPVTGWASVLGAGIKFIGMKVTEGTSFTDPTFIAHRAGARQQPLLAVIFFHFPRAGNPKDQAERFMDRVGPLRPNERLCLDLEPRHLGAAEVYPTPNPRDMLEWVDRFISTLCRGACTDRQVLLYTSARVWREIGDPKWDLATAVSLWAPRYSSHEPELPKPWTRKGWDFWQQSESFSCPGVQGPCDGDVFRGSSADLEAWARPAAPMGPPVIPPFP
jgi:GH25 family lysozyme M1 (1,4-beta-N-acetylmuramidase)